MSRCVTVCFGNIVISEIVDQIQMTKNGYGLCLLFSLVFLSFNSSSRHRCRRRMHTVCLYAALECTVILLVAQKIANYYFSLIC